MIDLLKDRRIMTAIIVLVVFAVFVLVSLNVIASQKKELELLREQAGEMLVLKNEFLGLREKILQVEHRKSLTNVQGIVQAVDDIFGPLGLKDNVKSVKPGGSREMTDGIEEGADVHLEKVSMNEMVNIFYRIENVPMIITVKKAVIKKSFENPELLNISLDLSLIRSK
jgi:hypothetical protein